MAEETFKMPSSFSDANEQDIMEKKWKNFTGKTIDILQPLIPDVDINKIPGWGGDDDGDGQPSANFAVFMMSLIFAIFWITYITFFNSRVVGSLLTRVANSKILQRFIGDTGGYIKVGNNLILRSKTYWGNFFVNYILISEKFGLYHPVSLKRNSLNLRIKSFIVVVPSEILNFLLFYI